MHLERVSDARQRQALGLPIVRERTTRAGEGGGMKCLACRGSGEVELASFGGPVIKSCAACRGTGSVAMSERLTDLELAAMAQHYHSRDPHVLKALAELRDLRRWRAFCEEQVLSVVGTTMHNPELNRIERRMLEDLHDRIVSGNITEKDT